jgi:hypothetical protein
MKKILVLGFVLIAAIMFFAGTKYSQAKNSQLDYQIKLKVSYSPAISDSITLFDGLRKVGTVQLNYGEPFAELILSDNE